MFGFNPELPRGYKYAKSESITADEAVDIFIASGYMSLENGYLALQEWDNSLQEGLNVGIRHRRRLVGIGSLIGDGDNVLLQDLAVHPNHQHKGLGRALINRRVEIAESFGAKKIDVHMTSANTLGRLYMQLGFKTQDGQVYTRET